jgi:monoamine oxidase
MTPIRSRLLRQLREATKAASGELPISSDSRVTSSSASRRRLLQAGASLAVAPLSSALAATGAREAAPVAVIGGGLAGLSAAHALARAGIHADVYEAGSRLGGRCWSDRGTFDQGQVVERGGELIDTSHVHLLRLARGLGLAVDDVVAAEAPGTANLIIFDGKPYTLEEAVRDFAPVLPVLRRQLKAVGTPGYRRPSATARQLDALSSAEWIGSHVPGGLSSPLRRFLRCALEENFAVEADKLSAMVALGALAGSGPDELDAYGGSDQRFHIRGGNDAVVSAIAKSLPRPAQLDTPLLALALRKDGRCDVTIGRGSGSVTRRYHHVVLAMPFTNLRDVDLSRAGFRALKMRAIGELPMAAATKLQLQFTRRLWRDQGNTGYVMLDGHFLSTWEVTRGQDGAGGILNFWSSGQRAGTVGAGSDADQAREALAALERLMPGISDAWNGRVSRTVWDTNAPPRGCYAYYPPGYITSLLGIEAEPEGPVHFAGEHTSRDWQGFLNGAVETGQRAAREIRGRTSKGP